MCDIDPHRRIEQHTGEMGSRTGPGRAKLHAGVVRLRKGDELRQIADRQILARDQRDGLLGEQNDRGKIGRSIVEGRFVQRLVRSKGAGTAKHELVTIGRGFRDPRSAGHAACPADVFDDDLLAQNFRESRCNNPRQDIVATAGGECHHHGQRPRGPGLRFGHSRHGCQRGSPHGQLQECPARRFHGMPDA